MPEPQPALQLSKLGGAATAIRSCPDIREGNRYGCSRPNNRVPPISLPDSAVGTRPATTTGSINGQVASRPGSDGIGRLSAASEPTADHNPTQPVARCRKSQVYDGHGCEPVSFANRKRLPRKPFPITKGKANTGHERRHGQYGFDKDDEHDRELL